LEIFRGYGAIKMPRSKKHKEEFWKLWRKEHEDYFKAEDENLKYWKTVSEKINPIPKNKKGFLD
tara:strand:- start:84 stop:275 length:192 start_codon:yes stop_codon:yes gene_type:complete